MNLTVRQPMRYLIILITLICSLSCQSIFDRHGHKRPSVKSYKSSSITIRRNTRPRHIVTVRRPKYLYKVCNTLLDKCRYFYNKDKALVRIINANNRGLREYYSIERVTVMK